MALAKIVVDGIVVKTPEKRSPSAPEVENTEYSIPIFLDRLYIGLSTELCSISEIRT